jgi:nucleoside-diphosphate-sugar epimerase
MKILLIGGSGFLSSAMTDFCLSHRHEVTVITRGQRPLHEGSGLTHVQADRNDAAALTEALAGQTFDAAIDSICYNPEQAKQFVEVMGGRVGHHVMISTDFIYTPAQSHLPIDENAPRVPASPYGRGKAEAEDVLLQAGDRLPSTILRPPHIVGPGSLFGTGSLQGRDAMLPERLQRGEEIVLLDGGALIIQPADKRDIVAACLAVIESSQTVGKAYNIAGPNAVTTLHYYGIIADLLGVPLHVSSLPSDAYRRAYPERAPFTGHRMYSCAALKRDAGFRAGISLKTSLSDMLNWMANNTPAPTPEKPQEQAIRSVLVAHEKYLDELLNE